MTLKKEMNMQDKGSKELGFNRTGILAKVSASRRML